MKKAAAAILALALIVCIGYAFANAGTASDPLVSKDYVDNTFKSEVTKSGEEAIDAALLKTYNNALQRLAERAVGQAGYYFATGYDSVSVKAGQSLYVYTGGSVILSSGSASLNIRKGAVVNISDGKEVAGGTSLSASKRYFSAEKTEAEYAVKKDAVILVNGYYKIGKTGEDPPNTPVGRRFGPDVFVDVSEGQWFYEAVGYVYTNYIFNGVDYNRFGVNDNITRADFVTVLYRMAGSPAVSGKSKFPDVQNSGKYYYDAVVWASQNDIVKGYNTGKFEPKQSITREQMMAFMYRYAAYKGMDMTIKDPNRMDTFSDKNKVSKWAVDSVRWAIGNGVINGSGGKIDPGGTALRSQVAQIIYNFSKIS